jgi:bla regulator protein blaR1
MNFFQNITGSMAWTLLHSLWQGLILFLIVSAVRWARPKATSTEKYLTSLFGILLIVLSSTVTFVTLFPKTSGFGFHADGNALVNPASSLPDSHFDLTSWINDHAKDVVYGWMAGMLIFSIRFFNIWRYTRRLKNSAEKISGDWESRLKVLSEGLGLSRVIQLASSLRVSSPVLIGYLNPIILLPAGMVSGLSTDQLEAILLHELAHISRHDYLINILQSIVEIVFFFNPFVWLLSSQVRDDREWCCDDAVVRYANPANYATALQKLEEARTNTMVLAAAGNKNHLLIRIKRIMEPSKTPRAGGKSIPALLLVLMLGTASWVSIQKTNPEKKDAERAIGAAAHPSDTTGKKSTSKSATYSRKSVTTLDEAGKPHEEVTEEYTGDESLKPMMGFFGSNHPMPSIPEINDLFPIPPSRIDSLDMANLFQSDMDTFPPMHFSWDQEKDWENFGKEFSERFKEQFSDFYGKNKPEFDRMMKDLETKLGQSQSFQFDALTLQKQAEDLQRSIQDLTQTEVLKQLQHAMNLNKTALTQMSKKGMAFHFADDLTEQLIKDGYLKEGEHIESLQWQQDGDLIVNGHKIKPADRPKYKPLFEKQQVDIPPGQSE